MICRVTSGGEETANRDHPSRQPAGVLIGFKSDDDWFEFRLENDPRFLRRVAQARGGIRAGRGVKLEEISGARRALTSSRQCLLQAQGSILVPGPQARSKS